jgi:hypothetical protein
MLIAAATATAAAAASYSSIEWWSSNNCYRCILPPTVLAVYQPTFLKSAATTSSIICDLHPIPALQLTTMATNAKTNNLLEAHVIPISLYWPQPTHKDPLRIRLVMAHNTIIPETLDPLQFAYRPNRFTDDAISIALHTATPM